MIKACIVLAFFWLVFSQPLQAFNWETATSRGREYVTLRSFCDFYKFSYQSPSGNTRYDCRNQRHSLTLKLGSPDMWLDGVHYVLSFPVEGGDHDWLVSRMDVIKLFEPVLRPTEISGRHTIRGVVIDAGHGGSDNGATSRYGNEKTYTLDTANRLARIFNDAGLKTIFTRRSDVFVDLYERAHIASLYPDYAFVSVHYNSATPEARGLETYCLSPQGAASTSSSYLSRGDIQKLPGNGYDAQNILLASLVHTEITKLNPGDQTADRGVKRARFVVIKQNVLPAILVEGGFVSNRMEAARVDKPDYRQKLAQSIARGVIKFINITGDRSLSMPGSDDDDDKPAPKAIALAPPVPSPVKDTPAKAKTPVANDSSDSKKKPTTDDNDDSAKKTPARSTPDKSSTAVKSKPGAATTTATKTKKSKASSAKTVPTPELADKPVEKADATPAKPPESKPEETPSKPTKDSLNLTEPAPPAPTPGSEKAPPEPDEPPTVNIYPVPPVPKSSGTNAAPTE